MLVISIPDVMKKLNTRLRHRTDSTTQSLVDYAARTRHLKKTQKALLALHRKRGKPNVSEMDSDDFRREHELFQILAGTVYITPRLRKRAIQVFAENEARSMPSWWGV